MAEVVTASLHKHRRTTLERIEKYISDTYFTDVNLRGKLYPQTKAIDEIYHYALPEEEGKWQEFTFSFITSQNFQPAKVGKKFGPLWSTHWFKIEFTVPDKWIGEEVLLRWKSQSEAMIWSDSGECLQGLSTGIKHQMRSEFRISDCWQPAKNKVPLVYYIEMACNNMFGCGKDGMINPPDKDHMFTLECAEICTRNKEVYKVLIDLEILYDMAKQLEKDPRGYDALYYANHMINMIINENLSLASRVADNFFSQRNSARTHTLALMGHCHIDSAWLWPYSETKRKCARSWISTLQLMKDYPEMKFACSQAQQFDWVKTHYPDIYAKIKTCVQEGRFIPVGGTWVEMDGLIPSGESFMRQFLYGQKFFQKEFGITCKEFWLPDTFGYSAQFPQICKNFGISHFLTQKLSWSLVNKFPHHNFLWEGLDGTTILAHFPPGDTYEMNVTVEEGLRTLRNLEDKGRVNTSAFLYGYGDGGGGPTANMLERARRLRDVDGCPKMEHMSPNDFFERLERDQQNLCRWVGELYLELHNGTYTSQAKVKQQNRECEFALRNAEIILAIATVRGLLKADQVKKYRADIECAWKKTLLNQFHDVIPGSSIGIVYKDSEKLYQEALNSVLAIRDDCLELLVKGETGNEETPKAFLVNSLPWTVTEILEVKGEVTSEKEGKLVENLQPCSSGGYYIPVTVPGIGSSGLAICEPAGSVKVSEEREGFVLENSFIRAVISKSGEVKELKLAGDDSKDVFPMSDNGNRFTIYDDIPLFWDAWDTMDYHLETARILNENKSKNVISEVKIIEKGPTVARLKWKLQISEVSSLDQVIELTSVNPYLTFHTNVKWHENRKFLKVAFNTGLLARKATFDTQFGYLERPTHTNTSWESAMFEVCGHKWADLSEFDFGLSVFNDCKYGWTCRGNSLTLSLLRSPKAPDEHCDMGNHSFRYALMPHAGSFQKAGVQKRAYEFNNNLILTKSSRSAVSGSPDSTILPAVNMSWLQQLANNKARGTDSNQMEINPTPVVHNLPVTTPQETSQKIHCSSLPNLDTWFYLADDGAMIDAIKLSEDDPGKIVIRISEIHGGQNIVKLMIKNQPRPLKVDICNGLEQCGMPLCLEEPKEPNLAAKYCLVEIQLTPFKIANILLTYSIKLVA